MPETHHLRAVLRRGGFQRLFSVRLAGQFGDGVFQASLAGAVLFSPENQAHASDIAIGFAIILLPYSVVGPFAGVLLDRWWRQRVLRWANVIRAVAVLGLAAEIALDVRGAPFYASALVVISINRFLLSTLSASLPHTIDRVTQLVTANAFSTTSGGVATSLGGAFALGLRAIIGDSNVDYALIALVATIPYLVASFAARGFAQNALGPDDVSRETRETAADVFNGLVTGVRYLAGHKRAARALTMIAAQRFGYGIALISTVLMFRNAFHDEGFFRAELPGLAQVVTAVAIGTGLAAVITPWGTRHLGKVNWPVLLLVIGGVGIVALGLIFRPAAYVAAGFVLGLVSQGVKITVDTIVQQTVADEFRGRTFSLYDTIFNVTFVSAATFVALFLPGDGRSAPSVIGIGIGYLVIAAVYRTVAGRAAQVEDPQDVPLARQAITTA